MRNKITNCEWKLIINAGNKNFDSYAQAKLIRFSNITYASGVRVISRLVNDGLLIKTRINGRANNIKLTKLGIEVRELLLKLN